MIKNIYELREQVFNGLELKAEIIEKTGQDLDLYEQFKVRFTVTHKLFDPKTGWYEGNVRYVDCKLYLEGTPYAEPVDANPLSIALGDLTFVGQYVQEVVKFNAIGVKPSSPKGPQPGGKIIFDPMEDYVKARVYARFDIEGFFQFWHARTFWTQIEGG